MVSDEIDHTELYTPFFRCLVRVPEQGRQYGKTEGGLSGERSKMRNASEVERGSNLLFIFLNFLWRVKSPFASHLLKFVVTNFTDAQSMDNGYMGNG